MPKESLAFSAYLGAMAQARLIFGTVQLGQTYGAANRIGLPSENAAHNLIHRALELGVTTFDTAQAYGLAEERLGAALDDSIAKLAHVVTKLSPNGSDAVGSIEASLSNLRTRSLDTLMLHRAEHIDVREIWDDLRARHENGEIKHLGVSVQTPHELLRVLKDHDVTHIQMPYNILDWRWRTAEVASAISHRPDVIVHVRSAYLQGLFAAGLQANWPQVDGVSPEHVVSALEHLTHEFGRQSPADLCLAYLRAQGWINGIVVGMESEDQLESNVRLFAKAPLTLDQCATAEEVLPKLPEQFLNPALWPPAKPAHEMFSTPILK